MIDKTTFDAIKSFLTPAYLNYTTHVSPHNWALSLETGTLVYALCEAQQPRFIVDLGSGFSSYVVRSWQAKSKLSCDVWSVDDDANWLQRAKLFCQEQGVTIDKFCTWEEFDKQYVEPSFDFVLYDLGSMKTRVLTLERALKLCKSGGIFVIDDVHKHFYRNEVIRVCKEQGLEPTDMSVLTTDNIGRYCWIVKMP